MSLAKPPLGRLERVSARQYWASEAIEFTPWLAQPDNISLLGEALGLELEVEAVEKSVGPFRADILCHEAISEHFVLIENQLERTDHLHLGQLMTYAAGLDAVTVVWVAATFTEEHRAALDWLNRITAAEFAFFGVEIELWRIGDSPLAAKFNVVCRPNDWSRTVRDTAASTGSAALTPNRQLHLEFWTQFREHLAHAHPALQIRPRPRYYAIIRLGRSGVRITLWNAARDGYSGVYLETAGANSKSTFRLLESRRAEIEAALGPQKWTQRNDTNLRRIGTERASNLADRDSWPELNRWLGEHAAKLRDFYLPLLSELRLPEQPAEVSTEDDDPPGSDEGGDG